jgi:signal transduction histidine kinase/ligand-binding sensor domain-containing protein
MKQLIRRTTFLYPQKQPGILAVFFWFLSSISFAQLDPDRLTNYEEVGGTNLMDVISDRDGNLWIATMSGLVKFDGYTYNRFHPDLNDSTTMGSLLTYSLHEDDKGNIFIGGMFEVYIYNPVLRNFRRMPFTSLVDFPEHAQVAAVDIESNRRGRIYIAVFPWDWSEGRAGLIYYDEREEELREFKLPGEISLNGVLDITADPSGNIYLLSPNGPFMIDTLNRISRVERPDNLNLAADEWVNSIQSGSRGNIWFTSTYSNLYSIDLQNDELEKYSMKELLPGNPLDEFYLPLKFAPDGKLWIGTGQGAVRFDPEEETFEVFTEDRNRSRAKVNSMHFDAFGNLWFGTNAHGLAKYSEGAIFRSLIGNDQEEDQMTTGWVHNIFEGMNGNIWMGSPAGGNRMGFTVFNQKTQDFTPYPYRNVMPELRWKWIVGEFEPGKMIFNTTEGMMLYDLKSGSYVPFHYEGLPLGVYRIFHDINGHIWFSTEEGVYRLKDKGGEVEHFQFSNMGMGNIGSDQIQDIRKSGGSGLWFCSNNGLFRYDFNTGQFTRHAYDPDRGDVLSSQDINSVHEDDEGIVWVGTWEGGLCRYDPAAGTVKTYSLADGLASVSIQGILGDEENRILWLSTFAGISSMDKRSGEFINYTKRDGISGQLFSDGSYLKSSDGLFFFGGENGVTWFRPEDITNRSVPPIVSIIDFRVGDSSLWKEVSLTGTADYTVLTHDQNNVSIAYTGIQYDNPRLNTFAYKLNNYEDSWREVGNIQSAYYYNLPPGKYEFQVKAANSHGVWNEDGATISFRILPPWWRTTWAYVGYGVAFLLLIFAIDRIQRRRILEKQKQIAKEKELEQAREIEKAYHQLKTTQSKLVHAEKMASLGELTAGIAHEIQNPLNFVNNFSELSAELIDEMKEELAAGSTQLAEEIADDIRQNLEKIIHHGKRADGIVKSMLQHSRSGNGEKAPTNINALADEYLRLSYHGLRAKDKSFNASFKLELDEDLPKVDVVPQDIGRVLLNLINNSFYAVSKKSMQNINGYKPEVVVTTNRISKIKEPSPKDNAIEIRIKDNGPGIPPEVKEKIFQPFFTTKAAGEGTGLGLSLSYDIITKGHGGDITLESSEGEGTTFIIRLPVQAKG